MSQSMYYAQAFNVMATDEATPMGGLTESDPSIRGSVRITPNTQTGGSEPSGQALGVEVVIRDSGLDVLGYLSMTQAQAAVDATVQAATPAPETVLPSGYTQTTTEGKVRLQTPGGRWVEFDPAANTFLIG